MKPNRRHVADMVAALQTVLRSTERAQRKGDANRLQILSLIESHPNCTPKALSEEVGIHASSITRQMQALEKDGLVHILPDAADGRSCRIALASPGKTELERLREIGLQRWSTFVAKWDPEDVQHFTRLLLQLEQSKQQAGPPPPKPHPSWRKQRDQKSKATTIRN
jgi:DNA-binding MarR family transcriptional regulator